MTTIDHPSPANYNQHQVVAEHSNERLDRLLANALPDQSRTRIKNLIIQGHLSLGGGTITDPSYRVKRGEVYSLYIPAPESASPAPETIPLNIIHEDDDLIVIDKPAGLVVHPAPGNSRGTLVNALLAHCGDSLSGIGGVKRPGIVHRLDKQTSGLIVAAKNDHSHTSLSEQFSNRTINRAYQAVVWGVPRPANGTIESNIGRNKYNRKKMAVLKNAGRHAITGYKVLKRFGEFASLVECRLLTGRTHQIRVHMSNIGHPVIGDAVYGGGVNRARRTPLNEQTSTFIKHIEGQALHAFALGFRHPKTGENIDFSSQLPIEIIELITLLESF